MADERLKPIHGAVLKPKALDYDTDDQWEPAEEVGKIHTVQELIKAIESNQADVEARVFCVNRKTGETEIKKLDRKGFLEAFRRGTKHFTSEVNLREAIDAFAMDTDSASAPLNIGDDFVPLLGGNFYKNLYFYDYIRQANAAFWALNHDPIAHQAVNILVDFTLGRGYRVDSDNDAAMVVWRAFEKANKLPQLMQKFAKELSVYGESMIWKLPNQETNIVQHRSPTQPLRHGLIPRVRLIDPSVIWEVVTWPEDPDEPLYYVWVAPTAYQIYTGMDPNQQVPSSKFVFQTIPADQVLHYKVNDVTGEKRGRSDLFPVLGFLKRLRDSVNYSLIALQKQASYCIDTTVEGSQADIDAYIDDQQAQGTIAPAGSEFVHTSKIQRKYMGVEGGKVGANPTFEWCISMIASGMGIPISYFGTHLSGGQTRASAIVATEPVAKRFEMRQAVYERVIQDLWDYAMEWAGLGNVPCEVTFPDIITSDRTQKLKDLVLAEQQKWISQKRAGSIAAKELNITDYEYDLEQQDIAEEAPAPEPMAAPLSMPGQVPRPSQSIPGAERSEVKKANV